MPASRLAAEFSYHVLIIEPGPDHARRLAGELIHPPGAADFSELGCSRAWIEPAVFPCKVLPYCLAITCYLMPASRG